MYYSVRNRRTLRSRKRRCNLFNQKIFRFHQSLCARYIRIKNASTHSCNFMESNDSVCKPCPGHQALSKLRTNSPIALGNCFAPMRSYSVVRQRAVRQAVGRRSLSRDTSAPSILGWLWRFRVMILSQVSRCLFDGTATCSRLLE